jgi:hypothetical protein
MGVAPPRFPHLLRVSQEILCDSCDISIRGEAILVGETNQIRIEKGARSAAIPVYDGAGVQSGGSRSLNRKEEKA